MKQFSIFFLVLLSTALFAQKSNYNIDKAVNEVAQLYKLSDTQKTQYKEIITAKNDTFSKIMKETKAGESYQEEIKNASKTYDDSFLAILDDRQKQIFYVQKRLAAGALADRKAQTPQDARQIIQAQPKK